MISIESGDWDHLETPACAVRTAVFVHEQAVAPEEEWDILDAQCLHFVARDRTGNAVGTARLLPDGHIGRMAVLKAYRGQGIGDALLLAAIEAGKKAGHRQLALNAQLTALNFYARHGFIAHGEVFDEAGIDHRAMRLSL